MELQERLGREGLKPPSWSIYKRATRRLSRGDLRRIGPTKLRLGCRHSFGDEQLPVISYFSHHTSMGDPTSWAAYKTFF
jgi:hypothetical protein